jgi:hypothetical protein
MNGSGAIDLRDFSLFTQVFLLASDEGPPNCSGALGSFVNLTAFRPQHGAGYAPFAKSVVAEADEASFEFGPGIRMNSPGDIDPAGEDDLVEMLVTIDPPGAALRLVRSDAALRVWTTRTKAAGTEIAFVDNVSGTLPIGMSSTSLILWVEWASATHGTAEVAVELVDSNVIKDVVVFHTFEGIVLALGGEGQAPTDPADANAGTFVSATLLYRSGYDVHMYDEDNVSANGSGAVYNEAVTAIQSRGVRDVAIYGYSHGGGSTYDLADRLDFNRLSIGTFVIQFTSYADSVSNNSDVDVAMELRRPPSTGYHLNHYQEGSFFEDFLLDGGPVPDSNPPPTGLNVETTPWGANSTHFTVDDYLEVRSAIEGDLTSLTAP